MIGPWCSQKPTKVTSASARKRPAVQDVGCPPRMVSRLVIGTFALSNRPKVLKAWSNACARELVAPA